MKSAIRRIAAALLVSAAALLIAGEASAQQGTLVYVPNSDSDTVSVLRTLADGTLEAVATIPAPGLGYARAAVRGDQAFVYVTASDTNQLYVIDTRTNTIVQTVATGDLPIGVTVSPDGTRVYVANYLGNSVSVFSADATTGQLAAPVTIAAGAGTRDVAVSTDGSTLYVANQVANTVMVYDTSTNTFVANVTVGGGLFPFNQPVDFAVSPDGTRVYVVGAFFNRLSVIDTATNAVIATPATGPAPVSVAVTPDGAYIYVVNQNDATISQYNASDYTLLGTTPFFGVLFNHDGAGAVITPDGAFLYATEFSNATDPDQIRMFSITNGVLAFHGTPSLVAAGNFPAHPAICGAGNGMLASGGTFVANTAGAVNCAGAGGLSFAGGTLLVNGAGLTFGTAVTFGSAGGTVNTNGNSATISGGISGPGGLTKAGAGTLTLTGTSSYTGATAIAAGTLQAGAANVFSPSSAFTVSSGATLDLNGFSQAIGSLAGAGTVALGSGTLTTGGDNTSTAFSGSITGSGGLTKSGTGAFTLSGTSDYTGATAVNGGILRAGAVNTFAASSAFTIASGATLDFNSLNQTIGSLAGAGNVTLGTGTLTTGGDDTTTMFSGSISGAGALIKTGTGALTLGGANTYTGATTIAAGTLQLGHAQALGGTSGLTIDAPGTLDLNGFSVSFDRVAGTGAVALGGGTFTLGVGDVSSTFAGRITGAGTFAKTGVGTLTLTGGVTHSGATQVAAGTLRAGAANTFSAGSALTVETGATADLAGFAQTIGSLAGTGEVALGSATLTTGANGTSTTFGGTLSGTGSVVKTGSGTWTLAGANSYTGATLVDAGTLHIGAAGALGATSGVTVQQAGTLDLNGFDHAFGTIGGTGTVALGAATLTLGVGDVSSTLATAVTGSGSLVKTGSGVLALTGTNTYAGGTTVAAGALAGSTASLQGAIRNDALVAFDQGHDGVYTGTMSGSGAVIKQGAGSLTLTGTHLYTGGTLVSAGTLIGTTQSLQGTVQVDAALRIDQAFNGIFGGTIGGSGTLTKTGGGTLTLNGAHPLSGLTTVGAGTLALHGTLAGSVTVLPGAAFAGQGALGGSLTVGAGAVAGTSAMAMLPPAPAASASTSTGAARPAWATAAADVQASVAALGQLHVAGDLVVGPGGTVQAAVTGTGDSTLLSVGGVARLGGATLDLTALGGAHPRVMQTAVLSAAGGVLGHPTVHSDQASIESFLASDGHTLYLTVLNSVVPLAGATASANGAAVAGVLDRLRAGATGDLHEVTRELAALDDRTLDAALDQVAGAVQSTALQLTALDAEAAADLIRGEVARRRVPIVIGVEPGGAADGSITAGAWGTGRRAWGHLLGQRASFDATPEAAGARGHVGGFALGMDRAASDTWVLGAGGGYGLGELTLDDGDTADYTAPRAFGYAGYGRGRWTAQAGGSIARPTYQTERALAFTARLDPRFGARPLFGAGVDRQATAESHGLDTGLWIETNTSVTLGAWQIQPGIGLRTARYARDAWTETGAGALSPTAPDQAVTSTQADVSVRVARAHGGLRPYGAVTYRRELGAGRTITTLQFSPDAAGVFEVQGQPFAANRFIGTAGLTTTYLSVGYRFDTSGGQTRHAVDLGVRMK